MLLFKTYSKLITKQTWPLYGRYNQNYILLKNLRSMSSRLEPCQAENMMDIGTRDLFSEEHDIFRQQARKFYQQDVAPLHEKWDNQGFVDKDFWKEVGKQGLLGINIPAEYGGVGADFLSTAINLEEQAYANVPGVGGMVFHSDVIMKYIANYGTKEQIEKYIPNMTNGTCISALAMTEPGAGSDLQGIRTNAIRDGNDWILNGSKVFITNGYLCDVVIVVALTDTKAKNASKGISLFLVDTNLEGFKKGKLLKKIGCKAQDTAELFFEDVRLPDSALLGKLNGGFLHLMKELPRERLLISMYGQAVSEYMFEETRTYICNRKAFGKTLSHLQTVQHKMAEMKSDLAVGRAFTDKSIDLLVNDRLDSSTASIGKYWITEMQNKIAAQCLQFHGGWGYMYEYPISRAFVDSKLQTIYGGANEIMKELVAREIINR